MTMQCSTCTVN